MAEPGVKRARAEVESRVIQVDGRSIPYLLKRSARRTMALQVAGCRVSVAVPRPVRVEEVERFIACHGRWLLDKLAAQARQTACDPLELVDGALIPVLGGYCRLRLGGAGRGARWVPAPDGVDELRVGASVEPRSAIVRCLKLRALTWFEGRVAEYCHRLGVHPPPLRLSSARTRWGSCSARSGIRLHWRLIHLPAALGDYVVAHEVAHLVHMSHSQQFWAVVERLYPDWKHARRALHAAAGHMPELADAARFPSAEGRSR